MPTSRRNRRVEIQQELYTGLSVEASHAGATEQALVRAIVRAALITVRRHREGAQDPVAYFLAEGCVRELAAREHWRLAGALNWDGSLAVVVCSGEPVVGNESPAATGGEFVR